MKPIHLFKTILLAAPVIILIYVFLIRDRIGATSGIGGGSYDLTKMYTLLTAVLYLFILNLALLIHVKANRFFLLAGVVLLIGAIIMAIRNLN